MDPVHALWIKRGETLADLIIRFFAFLSRIRNMNRAPELPIDAAATARRSAEVAVAIRNGKQLRSEALRAGARDLAEAVLSEADGIRFDPRLAEPAPARYRSRLFK